MKTIKNIISKSTTRAGSSLRVLEGMGFALLLLALPFIASSCSDDDKSTPASVLTISQNGTNITELNLSLGESTVMLSVNTDGNWTASVPDADTTWVHITPHAGYGWEVAKGDTANRMSFVKLKVDFNQSPARTSAITFKAGGLEQIVAINQKGISGNDPIESVWTMVQKLKLGYNLGNTLESSHDTVTQSSWFHPKGPGDWRTWETCWGQPVTTPEIIQAIVNQGFNIIRVPVSWFPHIDGDWSQSDNWTINEEWMSRVEEVVKMVTDAGAYCILNVMHDVGAHDPSRIDNQCWLTADPDKYEANTKIYQKLWQQIATRFRNYDDKLIFESFNEILDKNYSWTAPAAGNDAYKVINKLQQDFVNVVRNTGGNNEYRNLAITTYAATGNTDAPLKDLVLPQDTHENHIYLSIHSYDPYNFCSNNAGKNDDGTEYDYNIKVFNDDCKAEIDAVFARLKNRTYELGIPFIFGEFGAIDEGKEMAERVKYATYLGSKFKEYNTTGLWWMGLLNRSAGTWYEDAIVSALFEAMK